MTLSPHLLEAAKNRKLIPLVGAGVSMSLRDISSGERAYPSWPQVLQRAAEELRGIGKENESSGITAMLALNMYQHAADIARKGLIGAQWGRFLASCFDIPIDKLDINSTELPKAIWSISNKIITLNFDKVLRLTCSDPSVIDFDYTQGAQLSNFLKNSDEKKYIWHLHGRIDNFPSLIFTTDSYASLYSTDTSFQAAIVSFKAICATQNLLFIGCSLSDAEILAKLGQVAQVFQDNIGPHYALVRGDEVMEVKEKLKGLPIEIISFTEFGEPLLEVLRELKQDELRKKPKTISNKSAGEKIAVLISNPIDRRYVDSGILKEIKKLKSNIHILPLNIHNLNSLSDFEYIFILTSVQRGKVIVEDEWVGVARIGIDELLDNISDPKTEGIFIFLDTLDLDKDSIDRCRKSVAPVALYSSVEKSQMPSLFFKIFKKAELQLNSDSIVINKDNFSLHLPAGISKEVRLSSPLSDAIDPRSIKKFVGRKDDLKNLCKLILDGRNSGDIVSIKGPGGIGKTILVKACAVEFSSRGLFAEGIFFVDCEFVSDFSILEQQLARIFDFEKCDNFKEELRNHRSYCDALLILDNAESLLLLPDAKNIKILIDFVADYCTVVITTRELLETDKEVTHEVRQLTSDEALELFKQELGTRELQPEEERFVRERIIEELLDNNPLAIKLITRNMPSGKDFRYLYDDLSNDVFGKVREIDSEIFSSESDRNVERKRSIYASINYSYSRLSDKEKSGFEILSLFPAGINMETFKRICTESKSAKKKKSAALHNPINKFIISDAIIKSLESKSVIEIDNNIVCLQSLVGRFAEFQFNKKSSAEIRRLRRNAFDYVSSFAESLISLLSEDNKHGLIATRIYWDYQKNFIKCVNYINEIDITPDQICDFMSNLSVLCFNTCTYSSLLSAMDDVKFHFPAGSIHERLIRMVYLSHKYFNGDFSEAAREVRNEYPLEQLAVLDSSSHLVRNLVGDALNIYCMEGYTIEALALMPSFVKNYDGYPDILHTVGEFDIETISRCRIDFFTLEAKLACQILNLDEIDDYIKDLHKQEHLERMQTNYVRAKLTGSTVTEVDRLVVINPYTAGIKNLILAITSDDESAICSYFKNAISNLFHIKYYYVEAHYLYAKHLQKTDRESEFLEIKAAGISMSQSHGYRYLCYLFNQMDEEIMQKYQPEVQVPILPLDCLAAIESIRVQKRRQLSN